jgi:hypothetical protein
MTPKTSVLSPLLTWMFAAAPKATGPAPFGCKMGWLAIKAADPDRVASSLGLKGGKPASWTQGIAAVYGEESMFVTPPVRGWVCAASWALMGDPSVAAISQRIVKLSGDFGEAQAFATYRVIEYHHWMLARRGQLIRSFAYLRESDQLLANVGALTPAERKLRFFNLPQDRWSPDESDVMMVARDWSLDPTGLTERSGPAERGILGEFSL